jgi:hypothetical protein
MWWRGVGRTLLWDHKARCNPGHTQKWMYWATIMASVKFLRDKPCSKHRVIFRWETVQYARQINWRWLRWRKNDRRCPRRGFDDGTRGDRVHFLSK